MHIQLPHPNKSAQPVGRYRRVDSACSYMVQQAFMVAWQKLPIKPY